MSRTLSEPPLNKLEYLRAKFSKLTKVKGGGFVNCSVGKSLTNNSLLKSIHSEINDEKTLLKSIQQDVNSVIQKYKGRIDSISKVKVERESLKSACDFSSLQLTTTPKTSVPHTKRESEIQRQSVKEDSRMKSIKQRMSTIPTNKSNYIFKIIGEKQTQEQQKKKSAATKHKKSNTIKEISINLCNNKKKKK